MSKRCLKSAGEWQYFEQYVMKPESLWIVNKSSIRMQLMSSLRQQLIGFIRSDISCHRNGSKQDIQLSKILVLFPACAPHCMLEHNKHKTTVFQKLGAIITTQHKKEIAKLAVRVLATQVP